MELAMGRERCKYNEEVVNRLRKLLSWKRSKTKICLVISVKKLLKQKEYVNKTIFFFL